MFFLIVRDTKHLYKFGSKIYALGEFIDITSHNILNR